MVTSELPIDGLYLLADFLGIPEASTVTTRGAASRAKQITVDGESVDENQLQSTSRDVHYLFSSLHLHSAMTL